MRSRPPCLLQEASERAVPKIHRSRGFSIVELLVVLVIIGILAAALVVAIVNTRSRAYNTSEQACARSIQIFQERLFIVQESYVSLEKEEGETSVTGDGNPDDNLVAACMDANMVIVLEVSEDGSSYEGTVRDVRGGPNATSFDPRQINL